MGIGDKPDKLFFTLLKANQQRENMVVLVTNSNGTIIDEEDILQEVSKFYGPLFKSFGDNKDTRITQRDLLQYTTNQVTQIQQEEIEQPLAHKELRNIMK